MNIPLFNVEELQHSNNINSFHAPIFKSENKQPKKNLIAVKITYEEVVSVLYNYDCLRFAGGTEKKILVLSLGESVVFSPYGSSNIFYKVSNISK